MAKRGGGNPAKTQNAGRPASQPSLLVLLLPGGAGAAVGHHVRHPAKRFTPCPQNSIFAKSQASEAKRD